tara:strand:+ start:1411 stop:2232 length:822 start_codon:yes stop_codon:yes gene_type:complete
MNAGLSKLITIATQKIYKELPKLEDKIEGIIKEFAKKALLNQCPPKPELQKIIQQKNTITEALNTIKQVTGSITKTGQTVSGILTGLDIAIKVIKLLPIPIAPFTPLTVTNTLADSLDTLGGLIKSGKGTIKMVPESLSGINPEIDKIIAKLSILDGVLNTCLQSQDFSPSELAEIIKSPTPSGTNKSPDDDLLSQLSPGSLNPILYKGFKLEIQYDPKNEFSFSSRRIKAQNQSKSNIILYNLINNGYSYSSSVEVLISEVKFRIDNYLLDN